MLEEARLIQWETEAINPHDSLSDTNMPRHYNCMTSYAFISAKWYVIKCMKYTDGTD